ncbi:hypothetical protein [Bacteroides thetaiotaomicron]|uniref:hypothetical protein n=1 Tax=Bacteroides thetaiotaomicron TaxID=818 RepID=UPI001F2A0586|nr:hypothetical protein [Bacteroides thetaiotaomicron]MCE9138433.1 hypothetical protein [Bacteroides thetaiotaomicron]
MTNLFCEFKKYIINHPRELAYKPSSDKYDADKLIEITKKLTGDDGSDADISAIVDFRDISTYLHRLYVEIYQLLDKRLSNFNLSGKDITEYIIAALNREYKVVNSKYIKKLQGLPEGSYNYYDMMNFKIRSAFDEVGEIDARSSLEAVTDGINLVLNYLRRNLDKVFFNPDAEPSKFAANIIYILQIGTQSVVFKHAYDDMLYNEGRPIINYEEKVITFDYDNHENLKLLRAGDMMFSERRLQTWGQMKKKGAISHLKKYIANYRIKKVNLDHGCITLSLVRGISKDHNMIIDEMQSAIDAFYEFLDGSIKLTKFENSTMDESVSIWVAVQYIAFYILHNVDYDVSLYTQNDFEMIPSKIRKNDLIDYVVKLTNIKRSKVKRVLGSFEVDWKKYNDIYSSPLYPIEEYYLLPFYPIINAVPYNIIDHLLNRGGYDLDVRGKSFEKYLYDKLSIPKKDYAINCLKAGDYGPKENSEEIDIAVSLKNVVLVAEAKCIHYSIEPSNYHDAWRRLEEGCEQAVRKAKFMESHPEYFASLGDIRSKAFIPMVITNYPTFTGFSHKGVYVIDSHSFLAYINSGTMSLREWTNDIDQIKAIKFFYRNEDEFSNNFADYLQNNPVKSTFMKHISIIDNPILIGIDPWKCYAKTAWVNNDPRFNI